MLDRLTVNAFSLTIETSYERNAEACFHYYTSPVYKYIDQIRCILIHIAKLLLGSIIHWVAPIYEFVSFIVSSVISLIKILIYITFLPFGCFILLREIVSISGLLPAQHVNKHAFGLKGVCNQNIRKKWASRSEDYLSNKYKCLVKICRTPVRVDNMWIDAITVILKPNSRRWILVSDSNASCYEKVFASWVDRGNIVEQSFSNDSNLRSIDDPTLHDSIIDWAHQMDSNVMFYNYPNVALSRGSVSVKNLTKAHRGCVNYLLDNTDGPGSKEILCYGFSLGGCIQAESLHRMSKQETEKIKLVVTDRSGYDLSILAGQFVANNLSGTKSSTLHHFLRIVARFLFKMTGLNMESYKRNKNLACPELYTTAVNEHLDIIDDGVFDSVTAYAVPYKQYENTLTGNNKKHRVNLVGASHTSGFNSSHLMIKNCMYLLRNDALS